MTAAYLAKLNTEQRRAVEHGCAALDEAPPLLIIAGAGSGKTNTLANRVAHLIVSGADPRRIFMMNRLRETMRSGGLAPPMGGTGKVRRCVCSLRFSKCHGAIL
jgi:UvrD/REP helicase N-terminal domain